MLKQLLTIFLIAFGILNSHAQKFEFKKDSVFVVLLAGQSNMAGAGNYDALSEEDKQYLTETGKSIGFVNDKAPEAINLTYVFAKYQLEKRGFGNVFGPELFIGASLHKQYPKRQFLFIKTTQGGTSLYGAWNPDWSAEKVQETEAKGFKQELKLYEDHITAIKQQLTQLEKSGIPYKIIGLAWMQGENDAAKEVSARSYETNLKNLINRYRIDLKTPEMPVVIGQINSHYGKFAEGPDMVRTAMEHVAEQDKRVEVVKTVKDAPYTDFPKHDDQVHYDHIGQKNLGTAMGASLIMLQKGQ